MLISCVAENHSDGRRTTLPAAIVRNPHPSHQPHSGDVSIAITSDLLIDSAPARAGLPQSAVRQWIALSGLAAMLLVLALMKVLRPADMAIGLLILFAAFAAPIIALEQLFCRLRPSVVAHDDAERLARVLTKLIGLAGTLTLIALAYWVFPIYRNGQAQVLLAVLDYILWPMAAIAPLYIWITDRRLMEPRDGAYMAGCAMLGRWADIDQAMMKQYALGWLVKAFFLPIMITLCHDNLEWFLDLDFVARLHADAIGWYDVSFRLLIFIDLLVASVGYLLTFRLLDSQIRSADATTLGWLVCLACYAPFWGVMGSNYFTYDDDFYWGHWLAGQPELKQLWGLAIIVLMTIYCWATVSFGIRFSNLTHRGILTSGPYRWSKHPAYLAKNISFWLISIPFVIHGDVTESLRQCLMLAGVNMIYYWRAKTEERHLSWDPVYRAYSGWINQNGLVARLKNSALLLTGQLVPKRSRARRSPAKTL